MQGRIECNKALTFQASLNGEDNGGSFRVNCSPRSSVSPSRTADRRRPIASSDVVPLLRRASRPGNPSLSPSPLFSGEEQSRRRWWKWMMSANITSNDYFAPSN
nr:hypothetical protein Itr_chr14CG13740 [Ipomoea trifida]